MPDNPFPPVEDLTHTEVQIAETACHAVAATVEAVGAAEGGFKGVIITGVGKVIDAGCGLIDLLETKPDQIPADGATDASP